MTTPLLGRLTWIATILCLAFVALQFIRPELNNPPVTAELQVPSEVKQVLQNSCYNCHSNQTKLPWFDQVVPAYWMVASDVKEARKHVNFSEIGTLPAAQQKAILYEAVNQIQLGAMPLAAYKLVHPGSVVTPDQLDVLKNYLNPAIPNQAASSAEIAAADAEYDQWIDAGGAPANVSPALNGVAFIPDYKNWNAISSTERFDNHTMRVVLGNDVAVKAIAANHINPWPDGTAFAKVSWFQLADDRGMLRPGAFQQVEFMIRDSGKYANTKAWGWARYRGTDLKPYGKDAAFAGECVGCHAPLRKVDYVYTMPTAQHAPLVGDLPHNPLQAKVITAWVNKQNASMSTLYGNDTAVKYARANTQHAYPAGSVLTLVTWSQQPDERWFGAKIPAAPKSVEFVVIGTGPDQSLSYAYQEYEGAPLRKTISREAAVPDDRCAHLLSQRAAVMP